MPGRSGRAVKTRGNAEPNCFERSAWTKYQLVLQCRRVSEPGLSLYIYESHTLALRTTRAREIGMEEQGIGCS